VIDLRQYAVNGSWHMLREGALDLDAVRELIGETS
jgi:hypothetical protein